MTTKSQKDNNVIGARGELMASLLFPEHWVVRKLERDFGIDLDVEVFRRVDGEKRFEATGQHFYVQVKASRTAMKRKQIAGHDVLVLKGVDTPLLHTVTAMGSANPVILLHIDIRTGVAHWVCLNDYIDKYLRPSSASALSGKTTRVFFNPDSIVNQKHKNFWMLEQLSRRARLVSMFHLVESLHRELNLIAGAWRHDPMAAVQHSMSDLRERSGLNGLNGIVQEILALDMTRPAEFSRAGRQPTQPRFVKLVETLSAIDDGLMSLYKGNEAPNMMLANSKRAYVDQGGVTRYIRDISKAKGSSVDDFFSNLIALSESARSVSHNFEKRARWIGLPFPAPKTATVASALYGATRARSVP